LPSANTAVVVDLSRQEQPPQKKPSVSSVEMTHYEAFADPPDSEDIRVTVAKQTRKYMQAGKPSPKYTFYTESGAETMTSKWSGCDEIYDGVLQKRTPDQKKMLVVPFRFKTKNMSHACVDGIVLAITKTQSQEVQVVFALSAMKPVSLQKISLNKFGGDYEVTEFLDKEDVPVEFIEAFKSKFCSAAAPSTAGPSAASALGPQGKRPRRGGALSAQTAPAKDNKRDVNEETGNSSDDASEDSGSKTTSKKKQKIGKNTQPVQRQQTTVTPKPPGRKGPLPRASSPTKGSSAPPAKKGRLSVAVPAAPASKASPSTTVVTGVTGGDWGTSPSPPPLPPPPQQIDTSRWQRRYSNRHQMPYWERQVAGQRETTWNDPYSSSPLQPPPAPMSAQIIQQVPSTQTMQHLPPPPSTVSHGHGQQQPIVYNYHINPSFFVGGNPSFGTFSTTHGH